MTRTSALPKKSVVFAVDVAQTPSKALHSIVSATAKLISFYDRCSKCELLWTHLVFDSFAPLDAPLIQGRLVSNSSQSFEKFKQDLFAERPNFTRPNENVKCSHSTSEIIQKVIYHCVNIQNNDPNASHTSSVTCTSGHSLSSTVYLFTDAPRTPHDIVQFASKPISKPVLLDQDIALVNETESTERAYQRSCDVTPHSLAPNIQETLQCLEQRNARFVWIDTAEMPTSIESTQDTCSPFSIYLSSISRSSRFLHLSSLIIGERIIPFHSLISGLESSSCWIDHTEQKPIVKTAKTNDADVLVLDLGFPVDLHDKRLDFGGREPFEDYCTVVLDSDDILPEPRAKASNQPSYMNKHERLRMIIRGQVDLFSDNEMDRIGALEPNLSSLRPMHTDNPANSDHDPTHLYRFSTLMTQVSRKQVGLLADILRMEDDKYIKLCSVHIRPTSKGMACVRKLKPCREKSLEETQTRTCLSSTSTIVARKASDKLEFPENASLVAAFRNLADASSSWISSHFSDRGGHIRPGSQDFALNVLEDEIKEYVEKNTATFRPLNANEAHVDPSKGQRKGHPLAGKRSYLRVQEKKRMLLQQEPFETQQPNTNILRRSELNGQHTLSPSRNITQQDIEEGVQPEVIEILSSPDTMQPSEIVACKASSEDIDISPLKPLAKAKDDSNRISFSETMKHPSAPRMGENRTKLPIAFLCETPVDEHHVDKNALEDDQQYVAPSERLVHTVSKLDKSLHQLRSGNTSSVRSTVRVCLANLSSIIEIIANSMMTWHIVQAQTTHRLAAKRDVEKHIQKACQEFNESRKSSVPGDHKFLAAMLTSFEQVVWQFADLASQHKQRSRKSFKKREREKKVNTILGLLKSVEIAVNSVSWFHKQDYLREVLREFCQDHLVKFAHSKDLNAFHAILKAVFIDCDVDYTFGCVSNPGNEDNFSPAKKLALDDNQSEQHSRNSAYRDICSTPSEHQSAYNQLSKRAGSSRDFSMSQPPVKKRKRQALGFREMIAVSRGDRKGAQHQRQRSGVDIIKAKSNQKPLSVRKSRSSKDKEYKLVSIPLH